MNNPRILVVDDDPDLLHLIGIRLEAAGYDVSAADSGAAALKLFRAERPQAVITDLRMKGMDGHALFARLHAEAPTVPVIILTAHGTIPDAVAATQRGVFAFLTKPFEGRELLERVAQAVALSPPVTGPGEDSSWRQALISGSLCMDELLRQARRAADDRRPLLLLGPAGSGKLTLACAIHAAGPRAEAPFVPIACGSLAAQELEKKLFGGSGSAATGVGKTLQSAAGGTLYLSEIEHLSPVAQARLLPLMQSGDMIFGGIAPELPNVRLIAASAAPLDRLVRDGNLRPDLYYGLAATTLRVPPLAERVEDIPLLVAHFVERSGADRHFSPEAIGLMQEAQWPGNVRQLESLIGQAIRLSLTPLVPATLVRRLLREEHERSMDGFDDARRAFEREYLIRLLETTGGNVARAARIAQRNRTEFYKLLGRHDIDPAAFKGAAKA